MAGAKRARTLAACLAGVVALLASPAFAAADPPPNDDFANATWISPGTGTQNLPVDLLEATYEAGEQSGVGQVEPGPSVWFRWTPDVTKQVTLSTCGNTSIDTTITVYRGNGLATLFDKRWNDDFCPQRSLLTFTAHQGIAYSIQVGGYDDNHRDAFNLAFQPGPLPNNNNIANAIDVAPSSGGSVLNFNTTGMTRETNEPFHGPVGNEGGGRSIWYRFVALVTGNYSVNTCGSSFDTLLAAYASAGSSWGGRFASNDDSSVCGTNSVNSALTFSAVAGSTYYIAVDGYQAAFGAGKLTFAPVTPPAPEVLLDGPKINLRSASFYFGGTTTTLAFDCSVDNGAFASCTPGITLNNLVPGNHSFQVRLTDVNGASVTSRNETFEIVDAPAEATDDTATLSEDSGATAIEVLANDSDPDGGDLGIEGITQPDHGEASLTGGSVGTAATGLTYEPDPDFCNSTGPGTPDPEETFEYVLVGGDRGTVTVTVDCVDDLPDALDDTFTVAEDSPAAGMAVLTNDTDIDGGPKIIESVTQGANGTVVRAGDGSGLTYAPDPDFCGPDAFGYSLPGSGNSAAVTVTVTCIDDNPSAVPDTLTVAQDSPAIGVPVLANDTDIDSGPKLVTSAANPARGSATVTQGGQAVAYQPDPRTCGADSFTYSLNGGSSAIVSVTVTCPPSPDTRIVKATIKQRKRSIRAVFAGSGGTGNLTFECRLDKRPFSKCSSPKTFRKLKPGRHRLRVRAKDGLGRVDATPASRRFRISR